MRIAFYSPLKPPTHPNPSGDRRMSRLLIDALRFAGHRVDLVSELRSYDKNGDARRQSEIAARAEGAVADLLRGWTAQPAAGRPDIWFTYHLYHKAPDHLGPSIAAALNIPYVVAEASHAPKREGGPWDAGFQTARKAIQQARVIFCLTRRDRAGIEPLVGPDARLIFLPPFLDATRFLRAGDHAAAARAKLAAERDLDPSLRWLLAVGMMRDGDKSVSYARLADALARLPGDDWRLIVVGDGEAAGRIRAGFGPIQSKVCYLGAQDPAALPEIYAACDLYVWPAAGEAYGMAFLEAQAAGLPVVAGNERGVPDVVRDGETGLLATPGDAGDFASKVRRLLDDDLQRDRLGRQARRFVAEDRRVDKAAAILDEGLRWALNCC